MVFFKEQCASINMFVLLSLTHGIHFFGFTSFKIAFIELSLYPWKFSFMRFQLVNRYSLSQFYSGLKHKKKAPHRKMFCNTEIFVLVFETSIKETVFTLNCRLNSILHTFFLFHVCPYFCLCINLSDCQYIFLFIRYFFVCL